MQIECKVAKVYAGFRTLKQKLENANRQFRADLERRPGVLVVHLFDSALDADVLTGKKPAQVASIEESFERLFAGGCYRNVSVLLLVLDEVWEFDDKPRAVIKRWRRWSTLLIPHPHALFALSTGLFPSQMGQTLLLEIVKAALPWWNPAVGPYSMRNRFKIRGVWPWEPLPVAAGPGAKLP